jgi:hypothetical protein
MAYIVTWTLTQEYMHEDCYVVCEDFAEAVKSYEMLRNEEGVWCAALTKVMDATEPHWMDDLSDGPTHGGKHGLQYLQG